MVNWEGIEVREIVEYTYNYSEFGMQFYFQKKGKITKTYYSNELIPYKTEEMS